MESSSDDEILAVVLAINLTNKRRRKRSKWVRDWISKRNCLGIQNNLIKELELCDTASYKNYFRMDKDSFDILFTLIKPLIEKQDTHMRNSISAKERLSVTLRYLATGKPN
jgi:hypothetical protein